MQGRINSHHFLDTEGNPAGGTTFGRGFAIGWQNGPLGHAENRQLPNGAFVEDIILAAIDRLEYYQKSKFNCEFNNMALEHLNSALNILNQRTLERQARKVEGTHSL